MWAVPLASDSFLLVAADFQLIIGSKKCSKWSTKSKMTWKNRLIVGNGIFPDWALDKKYLKSLFNWLNHPCRNDKLVRISVLKPFFLLSLRVNKLECLSPANLAAKHILRAWEEKPTLGTPIKVMLLALPENIRLRCKYMLGTNALAYWYSLSAMKKESFITLKPRHLELIFLLRR